MTHADIVSIGSARFANDRPLGLIAGPCVVETEELTLRIAQQLKSIAGRLRVPFVFKASYDKANRSSIGSFRGVGAEEGLAILGRIKKKLDVPILTDVHSAAEVPAAAAVADVLQIPAFLCRQTDLVMAAAKSGRVVNIKKGQFLSPWEAENILKKARAAGSEKTMLTERGFSFGYNNLVVDMRGLEVLRGLGAPVVFDATHSVQLPGGQGGSSGGQREFIYPLARAAVALGVAAIFMEVHPEPEKALSDGPNAVRLKHVPDLLRRLLALDRTVKRRGFTDNPFH
ncbi:MAG: 3-deoxy-8-phosphooctulonate synthase [Elusimicrobia bacterium]|jgi:2-dehydro-3-deoxyphosphooctonate aldolase (KDO 8-P synthase)|nr:3-deoxy-8-phosphooctulonate synthase [Elusimicrobiota bacterium]MBK7544873.1 3-deoxy-8-phosphooctulonate synthase [Elusimicrobiota bacterium]MBK7574385.1 3-deoxy-8-phosphooctulonate synthase [Elusimicrobiota bacterium]MBK8126531.1 3-deoxy-8-phosphooctulonate synthase [Elusimicrobiota bacterium]MBK8650245.1 3-deoxy-8-phosphooctulonate synthase [Elusimicrobiota bacterium]